MNMICLYTRVYICRTYLVFHGPCADVDVEVNPSGVQKKCGLPPSQGLNDLAKHDLDAWAGSFGRDTTSVWKRPKQKTPRRFLVCTTFKFDAKGILLT